MRKAAEAAASFLLFEPEHEDMLRNMEYYITVLDKEEAMVEPREEAIEYLQREQDETNLLDYITDNFVFSNEDDEEELLGEEIDSLAIPETDNNEVEEIDESSLEADE